MGLTRHHRSRRQGDYNIDGDEVHYPTRPVDKDKAEAELVVNIKKATSAEETAPKQKHVRSASTSCPILGHALTSCLRRGHRLHLGLSLFDIILDWPEGTAYSV